MCMWILAHYGYMYVSVYGMSVSVHVCLPFLPLSHPTLSQPLSILPISSESGTNIMYNEQISHTYMLSLLTHHDQEWWVG